MDIQTTKRRNKEMTKEITLNVENLSPAGLHDLLTAMTQALKKNALQISSDLPSYDPNGEAWKDMNRWMEGASDLMYQIATLDNKVCRN
jgi:hypothetical protein